MHVAEALALPPHGGNLDAAARRYGVDRAALIDFSANINPRGLPPEVTEAIAGLDRAAFCEYPDPTALPLREAIAQRHGIDRDGVVVANGAAALLDAVLRPYRGRSGVVPVPAFSEYARAFAAAEVAYVAHPLTERFGIDEAAMFASVDAHAAGVLLINNPHNPSGALVERAQMLRLLDACRERDVTLIIDEAFIDYAPEHTCLPDVCDDRRLIIVRSLTKFYGMPGVRVGYALAHPHIAAHLRSLVPSWPVGALEIAAARAALGARAYETLSLTEARSARDELARALLAVGIAVFPSVANFLLLELPVPASEMDGLLRALVVEHGIVVRDARTYQGLGDRAIIRVAVRTPGENARLVGALRAVIDGKDA